MKRFVRWLNHTLCPSGGDAVALPPSTGDAPDDDMEAMQAYHTLLAARKEAEIRRAAFKLFYRSGMDAVLEAVNAEIDRGTIATRPDRFVHADVGLREAVLALLLGYNLDWLKIGLETVFGEVVDTTLKHKHGPRGILKKFMAEVRATS